MSLQTTSGEKIINTNELYDDLYYKDGDTISMNDKVGTGFISSATTKAYFDLTVPKSLKNISSFTVTKLYGTWRGIDGYLNSASSDTEYVASGYTIGAYKTSNNSFRIVATKSSAWTNATNNTPVSFYGDITIKLSA